METVRENPSVRTVNTHINYLAPGCEINRRFVAAGVEVNTGRYEPYAVEIRDARPVRDQFSLDRNGFVLAEHHSAVSDFMDKKQVDRIYPAEVTQAVQALTGASVVAARGWMIRTAGDLPERKQAVKGYRHQGGIQPPAGEAHTDFNTESAESMARNIYREAFPDGKPFKRFIASSLWRTFSPPPQDWPLALCDSSSVAADEGTSNTLVVVDEIPDRETMLGPLPEGAAGPAATIFLYNPKHRWWFFSNMNRDEVILLKFYDSDHSRAWRVPHTAFFDPTFPDAHARQSIEFRSFAFFL